MTQAATATTKAATAKMSVNQSGLMKAMVNGFAGTESIIKELAQNARRAKASRIDIKTLGTGNNMSLIVEDDGCGIDDFNSLLGLYQSGWDASVQSETPYGIGFLSCILASKRILVMSNGKKMDTESENILEFEEIEIKDIDLSYADNANAGKGTVIMLSGGKIGLLENINYQLIFSGFDIPVFLNGVEIPRPEALNSGMNFIATDAGQLAINRRVLRNLDRVGAPDYNNEEICVPRKTRLYFQGFHIGTLGNVSGCYNGVYDKIFGTTNILGSESVLHLDHTKFAAIAPDRHCLVDADTVAPVLGKIVLDVIKADLMNVLDQLSEDYILRSVTTFAEFGMMHLYNNLDVVPRNVFTQLNSYPVMEENQSVAGHDPSTPEYAVTKEDIVTKKVTVFTDLVPPDSWEEYDFKYAMYCWKMGGLVINDQQYCVKPHKDHWIWAHAVSPVSEIESNEENDPIRITVVGAFESELNQSENGIDPSIVFCDHYILSGPSGDVIISDEAIYSDGYVYFPKGAVAENSHVALQVMSFQDANESVDETWYDNVSEEFSTWIANAQSSDDPIALMNRLLQGNIKSFPSMFGKNFSVKVDEKGEFVIELNQ